MSHTLDLSRAQKSHNDESEDSDDDREYAAFAEELDNNWYDLIHLLNL